MRFRPIMFAWLLLFGATLAMGAGAWWLLGREAARVDALTAGTVANRTATVAENIDLLMGEIRDGVSQGLAELGQTSDPRRALSNLVEANPYIATGFYFRASDAVTVWYGTRGAFPLPNELSEGDQAYPWTMPEIAAVSRDDLGFEEVAAVLAPAPGSSRESSAPSDRFDLGGSVAEPAIRDDSSYVDEQEAAVSRNIAIKEQRAAVRKVSERQNSFVNSFKSLAPVSAPFDVEGAVIVEVDGAEANAPRQELESVAASAELELRQGWFSTDVQHGEVWLAWLELPDGENAIGVWLDRSAIIAEFSKVIHLSQEGDFSFGLVDARRRAVGSPPFRSSTSSYFQQSIFSLAIGSTLPGWRMEAYRSSPRYVFGRSFRLVGGLFIFGLCVAILLGGALLLWQAQRDARDAQRKTSFVANVSHELKTPLTSIRLFAEMLNDGRVKDAAKRQTYVQTILTETQRLGRLVNNVLDFSRLDRGRREPHLQDVDLGEAVRVILESQRNRLQGEDLQLVYDLPEAPIQALVDSDALEQILLNLLDNAAKYASVGQQAEVRLRADSSYWELRVADRGPGIPARERKQVFAAFHRVDDRLTAERPGCGLGLSISSRLAEEMGGALALMPNEPSGCCFTLRVPLNTIDPNA